jgi:hypothetical protein
MALKRPVPSVGISKRGGPQPAEKKAVTNVVEQAVRQVTGRAKPPAPLTLAPTPSEDVAAAVAAAAAQSDLVRAQTSVATADWKPTIGELQSFLLADMPGAQDVIGTLAANPITATTNDPAQVAGRGAHRMATNAYGLGLAAPLATAQTPMELADQLGIPISKLTPFLEGIAQSRASIKGQGDKAKAEVDAAFAPPVTGVGASPDSIDRIQDPFSLATAQEMSSDELSALIDSLDPKGSDQMAQRLAVAKQRLLTDTGVAIERQNQLAEAYRAGMAGQPMPGIPGAGESTAQDTYKTAGPASAAVAMPPVGLVDTTIDPGDVEGQVTAAAQLIEQQRQAEKRQQLVETLTVKAQQQKDAEDQVAAEAEKARKAADDAARKQSATLFDENSRVVYSRKLKKDLAGKQVEVTQLDDNGVPVTKTMSGDQAYEEVRRLTKVGANRKDILKQVFGVDFENGETPTAAQLAVIQAAQFSVGNTPSEMKSAWESFRQEQRQWAAEQGYDI